MVSFRFDVGIENGFSGGCGADATQSYLFTKFFTMEVVMITASMYQVSDGVNTDIPCVECRYGLYERHCYCERGGEPYVVLTCDQCGHWDYHDRYLRNRLIVQESVGIDNVDWQVDKATGLQYMTVRPAPSSMVNEYWDRLVMRMETASNVRAWQHLVLEASKMPPMAAFYTVDDIRGWSIDELRAQLDEWIEMVDPQ